MHLALPPGTPALSALRGRIETALADVDPDVVADVQLVATELVTNACLHGGPPVEFTLLASNGAVRLEVADGGADMPAVRDPAPDARSGRGLLLVAATTVRWGVTVTSPGKIVWAEFDRT